MKLKVRCNNKESRNINSFMCGLGNVHYYYILFLRTYKISLTSYGIMHHIMFFYSFYVIIICLHSLAFTRNLMGDLKTLILFEYTMKQNARE